jgi:hypothetical protein
MAHGFDNEIYIGVNVVEEQRGADLAVRKWKEDIAAEEEWGREAAQESEAIAELAEDRTDPARSRRSHQSLARGARCKYNRCPPGLGPRTRYKESHPGKPQAGRGCQA